MLIIQKNFGTELFSLLIQEHLSGAVFKRVSLQYHICKAINLSTKNQEGASL